MSHKNTRFVRNTRRAAALERQANYDSLTIAQRLALLDSRPGNSGKERARLEAQLSPVEEKVESKRKSK
jgi:hypothetical protein